MDIPTPTPTRNDPFAGLPEVDSFTLVSADITQGEELPLRQRSGIFGIPGGEDISPELAWSDIPEGTKSFVVTLYDPDAPTGSGFWHWVVADIPATVVSLPRNAGGDDEGLLPAGSVALRNDAGTTRFIGSAPPAGHGEHRYYFVVHALDVEKIGVTDDMTPALLGFTMSTHTLGRAVLVATATTTA